jgi:glycosyltransferase involved in cell wall biosynthesis
LKTTTTEAGAPMRALLVDPSLFTGPYDAGLTEGLVAAGVSPTWAVRPTRAGDRQEIGADYVDAFFYRRVDRLTWLPGPLRSAAKGVAHALGLARLVLRVLVRKPDVVHFQWLVVPPLDALAIRIIALRCPVVFTAHDTVPFNGEYLSFLQNLAFDLPIRLSDRVIVHTAAGMQRLVERGVPRDKVAVIPHGPLRLHESPSDDARPRDPRRTFVLFGEIKHYKGADLLIEAVGRLPREIRARARIIIAGRPRMDLAPLQHLIDGLGLADTVEIRAHRHSETEMANLFADTDCFVFPYRQIDASGVYFLTKSLNRWTIATRVGIFAEDFQDGAQGALIEPENPEALAEAVARAIVHDPRPTSTPPSSAWQEIGRATRAVYQQAQNRA